MQQYAKNELEILKQYEAKGYNTNFRIEDGKLCNSKNKNCLEASAIYIVAEHRFEGMSNPSDLSILYIIEADDMKGTLLVPYGVSADLETTEFIKNIPESNISNKGNLFMDDDK